MRCHRRIFFLSKLTFSIQFKFICIALSWYKLLQSSFTGNLSLYYIFSLSQVDVRMAEMYGKIINWHNQTDDEHYYVATIPNYHGLLIQKQRNK